MNGKTTNLTTLRQRAELALSKTRQELNRLPAAAESADLQRLIEELHVYQIELEIQNQELKQSQASQALALDKYNSLFRFLPLPALLIDERGLIVDSNRKAEEFPGLQHLVQHLIKHITKPIDPAQLLEALLKHVVPGSAAVSSSRLLKDSEQEHLARLLPELEQNLINCHFSAVALSVKISELLAGTSWATRFEPVTDKTQSLLYKPALRSLEAFRAYLQAGEENQISK